MRALVEVCVCDSVQGGKLRGLTPGAAGLVEMPPLFESRSETITVIIYSSATGRLPEEIQLPEAPGSVLEY